MVFTEEFTEFVKSICGGQLRMRLAEACEIAAVSAQTVKNRRSNPRLPPPPFHCIEDGNRLFVTAAELFKFAKKDLGFTEPLSDISRPENDIGLASPASRKKRGRPRKMGRKE